MTLGCKQLASVDVPYLAATWLRAAAVSPMTPALLVFLDPRINATGPDAVSPFRGNCDGFVRSAVLRRSTRHFTDLSFSGSPSKISFGVGL
jgi:hypothetical protein